MSAPHRNASVLGLCVLLFTGCEILDDLQNPRTLVNVSVTHHATAEAGTFPDRGADGEMREFETDEGWTVMLTHAYITTAGVSLRRCDDEELDFRLYWGPLAEDIKAQDLDALTVAGMTVEASEFCSIAIDYGPNPDYVGQVDLGGATFSLAGGATKDGVTVPFNITSNAPLHVDLDLSAMEAGGPLVVEGNENFPVDLTVSKTYDRFFDGIDFATATPEDLEAQVASVLALETAVSLGRVMP
ncbi:MAG TPA: hypothetical protein VG755_40110 [Nannocystaceae bacterium]|nr:hypothetical protein [Nannocystaceae bacterium]